MGESATYTRCVLALDMTLMAFRRLECGVTVTQRERHAGSPAGSSLDRSDDPASASVSVCAREESIGRLETSGLGGPPGSRVTSPKMAKGKKQRHDTILLFSARIVL